MEEEKDEVASLILLDFLLPAPCIWQSLVPCWSCLRCTGLWTVLGDHFRNVFRMQHSLVRQWIHVWRQFTRLFGRIFLRVRLWEMTSCCLRIQRSAWFDSGYMHCVSLRSFLKTLTQFLCAGDAALALFPSLSSGPVASHHGRYEPVTQRHSLDFFWEIPSWNVSYSAQCLVRQWILFSSVYASVSSPDE